MKDITTIDIEELQKDKEESLQDIIICENAIQLNIKEYSGGSVQERLDVNKRIVEKINKELLRRGGEKNGKE